MENLKISDVIKTSFSGVSVGLSEKEEHLTFTAEKNSQLILLSGLPLRETIFASGRRH